MIYSHFKKASQNMINFFRVMVSDYLYKNSIFILFSSLIASAFGIIYWIFAARFFPESEVGLATAIISVITLITSISRLGFDQAIIKYIPIMDKNEVLGTATIVTTLFSLSIGIIFFLFIDSVSIHLIILKQYGLLFFCFLIVNSIFSVTSTAFVALRKAEKNVIINGILVARVLLLVIFISAGMVGILASYLLSILFAAVCAMIMLYKMDIKIWHYDNKFFKESLKFSIGNYVAGLFLSIPILVMPIIVLNILGPDQSASYYMAYTIASTIYLIPNSMSISLFVEGSHGEELIKMKKKAYKITLIIISLPIFLILLFGNFILSILGHTYVENGFYILQLLTLSSVFITFFYIDLSVRRINNRIASVIILALINLILLISLSFFLIQIFGLAGIGYSWILGNLLTCLVIHLDNSINKIERDIPKIHQPEKH